MDPFDQLLQGIHADGDAFTSSELTSPWTRRQRADATLTVLVVLGGPAWITPAASSAARRVGLAETVVVRGSYTLSDRPDDGRSMNGTTAARTTLLTGTYRADRAMARRLLGVLPPLLVLPDADGCESDRAFLATQLAGPARGPQIVLDRLLDWLLVCTLRAWSDQPGTPAPGLLTALGDETVGPVLRAMHAAPERSWTLATLTGLTSVARTTFVARFTELVGVPPLTYLTEWRLTIAADLLAGSTATVAAVARQVGYRDAFAFSAAFKRFHHASPTAYRRTVPAPVEAVPVASS